MKEIKLTQDKIALVDDEDYPLLSAMSWHAWYNKNNGQFYAHHSVYQKGKSPATVRMHHFVLGITDSSTQVDHENGNPLDNRKQNLRICDRNQNARNRTRTHKRNTSGYRGIVKTTVNKSKPWVARIQIGDRRKHLGYFYTAEEAARAFDKAAKEIYGEFCGQLNFT
jgi:hypothetical protein